MADPNDSVLLREYAERQSESAFSELVQRHIHFVYSVAVRLNSPLTLCLRQDFKG